MAGKPIPDITPPALEDVTEIGGSSRVAVPQPQTAALAGGPPTERLPGVLTLVTPPAPAQAALEAQPEPVAVPPIEAATQAETNPPSPASLSIAAGSFQISTGPASLGKAEAAGAAVSRLSDQVAQPLVTILSGAAQGAGEQQVVIRLDPKELGKVQITVERNADGAAQVNLIVERPETLALLQRDQPQLHKALERAGLQADGHTIAYSLLSASALALTDAGPISPGAATPESAQGAGYSGFLPSSGSMSQEQRRPDPEPGGGRRGAESSSWAQFDQAQSSASTPYISIRPARAGVDITA